MHGGGEERRCEGGACWSDRLMRHGLVWAGCVAVCVGGIYFYGHVSFMAPLSTIYFCFGCLTFSLIWIYGGLCRYHRAVCVNFRKFYFHHTILYNTSKWPRDTWMKMSNVTTQCATTPAICWHSDTVTQWLPHTGLTVPASYQKQTQCSDTEGGIDFSSLRVQWVERESFPQGKS